MRQAQAKPLPSPARRGPPPGVLAALLLAGCFLTACAPSTAPGPLPVLDAIDASHPRLEAVAAETTRGNRSAALALLLQHYAGQPPSPLLALARPVGGDLQRAREACAGTFTLQGERHQQPRRTDGGLDWDWRGPGGDKEWAWMLNRHLYFRDLIHAWHVTGDFAYLDCLARDVTDWIHTHPYPDRLSFSAAWRPLEVARRVQDAWLPAFEVLRAHPERYGEALGLMLGSLAQHGDALAQHASFWGGNHLLTEKAVLGLLAVRWPELAPAEAWLDNALAAFTSQLLAQTYPDGAHHELSNHYQWVVLENALHFVGLLEIAGRPLDPVLADRVAAMARQFAGVAMADGTGPLNNASDREDNRQRLQAHRAVLERLGLDPASLEPREPVLFPWAGQVVLREAADGRWGFFEVGPYGTAHQHRDRLQVSLSGPGGPILVDAGRYTYQPGAWKTYFAGPGAHNALLLDGAAARVPPRKARQPLPPDHLQRLPDGTWHAWGTADFPAGPASPHGGYRQTRHVLQLAGGDWLIVDVLAGTGTARVAAQWLFHPRLDASAVGHLFWPLGLEASPGRPAWRQTITHGQERPAVAGWVSEQYNERQPAVQVHARATIQGPTVLGWLICAEAPPDDVAPPAWEATFRPGEGASVRLMWRGHTYAWTLPAR